MKLVVDTETDKVPGASMCGPDAAEIMQMTEQEVIKEIMCLLNEAWIIVKDNDIDSSNIDCETDKIKLETQELDVSIPKTNVSFRLLYDTKGRFRLHSIRDEESKVVMVTGGRNRGRVGVIKSREKHKGSFETIHVQDATGHEFDTRMGNIFTIGKGSKPWVSLPKGKGIKLSIIEEAKKRHAAQVGAAA
ncbi:hypothetical protein RHGRI_010784 [Rhododendron griersonianum]|uniref:40S ribosomal protein S4 n=1 Tax=Rhododendron griersonianum TaxID=479676 RepID=A0AAV6KJX0_9ERIC|nr:hypothetical protein RHGRI_010784 [Rhododendron griersonianum]